MGKRKHHRIVIGRRGLLYSIGLCLLIMGFGGIGYMADVLGCSRRTITRGIDELDQLSNDPAAGRIRRPGAGRKKR